MSSTAPRDPMTEPLRPVSGDAPLRVAYLCGMYPAVSLTFILREIESLRMQGVDVLTCSVRRTTTEQHPGEIEQAHAASTFNILPTVKNPVRALSALAWAITRPRRFMSMLRLALETTAPGFRAHAFQAAYALEAVVLARHLDREGVGHIHNHFISASATVAMLAARLANIPISLTLHGPTDYIEPLRWNIETKIAEAAFVACISHYCRAQAMLFSDPAHWSKLKIVHCGVDPELYDRPGPARPAEPVELLFVGRLARVKGLMVLLDALQLIASGKALRLTIVGDGPERALLEEAARPLGERVRFTGYMSQQDVAEQLTRTDIFVLPSFAEGVPVVLMEAMAARVPVIATQVAGVSELVQDGEHGFLVPPGDVKTLADRIAELSGDLERRTHMGAAGREKVCAAFDIQQEAARIGTLFTGRHGGATRPDQLGALEP